MKIDRLIGIISILLQKEMTTAPEMAEHFEVSRSLNRYTCFTESLNIPVDRPSGSFEMLSQLRSRCHLFLQQYRLYSDKSVYLHLITLFVYLTKLNRTTVCHVLYIKIRLRIFWRRARLRMQQLPFARVRIQSGAYLALAKQFSCTPVSRDTGFESYAFFFTGIQIAL